MYKILNNILEMDDYSLQRLSKSSKLPSGYQQVGYIESTGTQYIDTDYKPNSNSKIEIEYIPTEIYSEFMVIYGTQNSSTSERFYGLISSTPYYLQMNFSNSAIPNSWGFNKNGTVITNQNGNFSSILQRVKVYVDNSSVRIESQEYSNTYNMTAYETWGKQVNCDYNLILFARNSGGIVSNNFIGKIYSCKIYDGDTLIRNYIPCYRKSDNEIGLYDIVNNVFYTNQGTGEFISEEGDLPSEYQQIEYIESTGTQYIDTGFKPNQNSSVELEGYITDANANSLFGSNPYFVITSGSTSNYCFRFRRNNNTIDSNTSMDIKSKLSILKNNVYINDNLIGTFGDSSFSSPYNSLICARNSSIGNPEEICKSRIYYVKIWDDTTLIRNFIPCYRKSDNEIGMYDLVTNTFFTNQGTGEFTYGSTSLALSTPVGFKGVGDRPNDLSFIDFNNWESEQYDINENKDIEETEQIKTPNILSDTYTSITADTEVQPNQVDFIPKAIDENKASEPTVDDLIPNNTEE